MNEESDDYHAYLLRLWRAQIQGLGEWRASLESPHTGERQSFATLDQLFAFILERCEIQKSTNQNHPIKSEEKNDG